MRRKRQGRQQRGSKKSRASSKRLRSRHCCGCSILSWEKKKFDLFHQRYFSETLSGLQYEQYLLSPAACNGGVICNTCGTFFCHDCVCAVHKEIKKDHPDLQDSWMEATSMSSAESVLTIPVGHCCRMKEKITKEPATPHPMSTAPILAGATHYYQYDLAIGSTPLECVDIFSLGASAVNAPITHAVFTIGVALEIARDKHILSLLELDGPTVTVESVELSMLPSGFNQPKYKIKVVKIVTTRTNAPPIGKIINCF
jgi:hypothetical protein